MPSDNEIREKASEVVEKFSDVVDLSQDEIAEEIRSNIEEFGLPLEEAVKASQSAIQNREDIDSDALADGQASEPLAENRTVGVANLDEDEEWIDLEVQFVDEWNPRSDSIAQVGLLADESGSNKFVSFKSSGLPELEEGKSYRIRSAVTDEYEGDYSVKLTSATEITEVDEDVDTDKTITAPLVEMNGPSGLVNRCSEDGCTRVIGNDPCPEHGDVDGELDMRLKAVLDTGDVAYTAMFDKGQTENVTGISFEEAKEIAKEQFSREAVIDEMRPDIVGRYFTVTGRQINSDNGKMILVNEFEMGVDVETNAENLLVNARSI